jgi:tetratricopeptide (TPR) repeat protein
MRRFLALSLLLSCAHGPGPIQPGRWHELQTDHFVLRTDLSLEDARRVAVDLEEVRAGLLAIGWHSSNLPPTRTQVIMLADDRELQDYAMKGLQGFVAADAFGEPIVVVSGSQDPEEQRFLKHELAHVITNQFLVRNPRWVAEGLACYLETLRFDRKRGQVVAGEWSIDRVQFLRDHQVFSYSAILRTGREFEHMSALEGWAFETGAWALVHWLVDQRAKAFDDMLERLARGEDQFYAFSSAFPDLTEATMAAGVSAYLKAGKARLFMAVAARWKGAVSERALPAAEVYATLADLQRLSPGYPHTPERDLRKGSLLALALEADPGHPLAIKLSDTADAATATRAHPDDWRAWLVFADKNQRDLAALQKAERLAPDNPAVLTRLAVAEAAHGDHPLAVQHASRAVEIAPGRSDLLAALGAVMVDAGRCEEGAGFVQRAIDVLPDGAGPRAIAALKETKRAVEEHCQKLRTTGTVERRIIGTPKGCDPAGLRFGRRDTAKGKLTAEFLVRKDGSIEDVSVKGDASAGATAAVKKYVKSCRYDPILEDGKPLEVRWQLEFNISR